MLWNDDAAIRPALHGLLQAEQLPVATAADGVTALTEFGRVEPDLVLLDVMMPGL